MSMIMSLKDYVDFIKSAWEGREMPESVKKEKTDIEEHIKAGKIHFFQIEN